MPIYEYECGGCAAVFEVYQKHTDPPPAEHTCGSHDVRRVLSNTSFVLKGTGWYATDYGNRSAEHHSGGSKKDGESKAESKDKGDGKAKSDKPAGGSKAEGKDSGGGKKDKGGGGGGAAAA